MALIPKIANFLGIDKLGKGLASAGRVISGQVDQDIQTQQQADASVQKLVYAARKEKDKAKRTRLLQMANAYSGKNIAPDQIDPGLNLSNEEVLGSAASTALNVAAPGSFKGGKAAVIAKNAALGAGFGAASGLEKNRKPSGVVGSTVGGAIVGTGLGVGSVATKAAKDFFTRTTPEWMMNHAVKPALNDLKKNVKYGQATLGKELLDEGVKGGPKKLLEIANDKLNGLETELQSALSNPALSEAHIARRQIQPYLKAAITQKQGVPGLQGEAQRIKQIYRSIPEEMTLTEANQMKRRIYEELRDPAYKLDAKLTTKAQALKSIARGLKTEIENAVGGTVVKDINRKLSIYGRLENTITDQMARSMRNNAFSLTDALLLVAGGASGIVNPDNETKPLGFLAALAAVVGRHNSTALYTAGANALDKASGLGTGIAGQAAKQVVRRGVLNLP